MRLRSPIILFLQWRHISSVVLRVHLLQWTIDSYNLLKLEATLLYIDLVISLHWCRIMICVYCYLIYWPTSHAISYHYPFSVYCVVITFTWIVDIVLWNRLSSLLSWTYLGSTSVSKFIRFQRFSTVSYIWHISELISRLCLCTRTCGVVGTFVVALSWWPSRWPHCG